ncbi:MAG: glycosyltransferase [Saprospiraceae bacterium]|nr:glycosyltransferase [Saprospiraceae bacterium]
MEDALIIFIKNPILGKVKTRIAATVGDEMALKVYLALSNYTQTIALTITAARLLYYDAFIPELDVWSATDFIKRLQQGDELGSKMHNAFVDALTHHRKAVIIGSDCATLETIHIQKAFEELEQHDVVIGPSTDGGYYLLGIKQVAGFLFENMVWSTETVLEETLKRVSQAGKSYYLLPELTDIDYWEDWERFGWKLS